MIEKVHYILYHKIKLKGLNTIKKKSPEYTQGFKCFKFLHKYYMSFSVSTNTFHVRNK